MCVLAKEQDYRAMQIDNFNKLIMQERTSRESQIESWRVYLTGEKEHREGREQNMITREELDAVTKTMWAEIRNHTHDVHALSLPGSAAAPVSVASGGSMAPAVAKKSPPTSR